MDEHEDLQDVDISILPEDEQPHAALEASNALPHFQFLDGKGAVQNSSERPIEGFIALKLTYEHVFKKQQERNRQLQLRNRQLASEVQHLRHSVDKSEGSPDSSTESTQPASSTDSLQAETLQSSKNKLRSGMVRLASCLLKREPSDSPLSEVLRKIIQILKSPKSDSEEMLKELCSYFDELGEWDDLIQWGNTKKPDDDPLTPTNRDAKMASNVTAPSDASLENLINNYQQANVQDHQGIIPKVRTKPTPITEPKGEVTDVKTKMERGMSCDEDMYGPATPTDDEELVPYNIVRLNKKIARLRAFPASFESVMQSMASRRSHEMLESAIGEIRLDTSPQRQTRAASDQKSVPTTPDLMLSFLPSIKMPPIQLPTNVMSSKDDNGTSLATPNQHPTGMNMGNMTGNTSPRRYDAQNPSGRIADLGELNLERSQMSEDFSYEQARGPPTVLSQTLTYDPNAFSVYQGSIYHVPRMDPYQNQVEKTMPRPLPARQGPTRSYTGENLGRKKPESPIHRASAPAKFERQGLKTSDPADNESIGWAFVPQGPYIPGSGSESDQLVTAHSADLNPTESNKQMECPVCSQIFPPDTLEQVVMKHVGLHFDNTPQNDSFEVLSS